MKRLISVILSLALCMTLLPMGLAVEAGETTTADNGLYWHQDDSGMTAGGWTGSGNFDIELFYSVDGEVWSDSPVAQELEWVKTAWSIPDYVFEIYGAGYYRFRVRPSEGGEWMWSDPYQLSGELEVLPIPSATLDSVSGTITITAGEGMPSAGFCYSVGVYYCGEDGTNEPVKVGSSDSSTVTAMEFSTSLAAGYGKGYYSFTVTTVSTNHTKFADSADYQVEGTYFWDIDALAAPTGLAWQEGVASWNIPDDDNSHDYVVELLRTAQPLTEISSQDFENAYGEDLWYFYAYDSESMPIAEYCAEACANFISFRGLGYYYFRVREYADGSEYACSPWAYCASPYAREGIKLDSPSELEWGKCYNYDGSCEEKPGYISWKNNLNASYYELSIYRDSQAVMENACFYFDPNQAYVSVNIGDFMSGDPESGAYTVTLRAMGDRETYMDSDLVTSGTWEYTKPSQRLAVSDPYWYTDDAGMKWMAWTDDAANEDADGNSLVDYYDIQIFFAATEEDDPKCVCWMEHIADGNTGWPCLNKWIVQDNGPGFYSFEVRPVSKDITKALSGEWTELSAACEVKEPETKMPDPTELEWHISYDYWGQSSSVIGAASFKRNETTRSSEYQIKFYRMEGDTASEVYSTNYYFWDEEYGTLFPIDEYVSAFADGGTYYFTVQAIGDGITTSNSEVVTSETWTYTAPDTQLAVGQGSWDTGVMTWSLSEGDSSLVREYEVRVYYSASETGEKNLIYSMNSAEPSLWMDSYFLEEYGDGWYFFTVRALSNDPTKAFSSEWSTLSTGYHYEAPSKLDAPTELIWGRNYVWNDAEGKYETMPGVMSWKRGTIDQAQFQIELYRGGESEDNYVTGTRWTIDSTYTAAYLSADFFVTNLTESGTYYFRVKALGDAIQYSSSDWVWSDPWTYTAPESQLSTITGLGWKDTTATWNPPTDSEKVWAYEIDFYFAATNSEEPYCIGGSFFQNYSQMTMQMDDWMLEEYGEGYYYFKIRPISGDITEIRHGEWSDMSPAMNMHSISEVVNDQLDEIINSSANTKDEVLAAIEAIDKDELAAAMSADQNNSETVQKIQALEEKAGVTTTKSVDEAMQATFDASKVTVVGAGLNAAGDGSAVELKISKADENVVIPAQYNNTVQFSMHLDGAADTYTSTGNQQLAVPVKIVLPVPAGVNPAFLVVLHYHADNETYDQILPYIYCEDGQWYASFVVDSFSNFALAEDASAVANGSGSILVSIKEELMGESTGKAIAAAYDEDGRLLGTGFLDESGQGEIECDAVQAVTVKVFLLDDTNAPVFQAAEINMKGSV